MIIGAGPAGLTAAYQLRKTGASATVLEASQEVGGISRTVERDGWRFDIGGHRFFTKVKPVEELWHEILPDEDFLMRPRKSRIFYNGKYYDYPLKAINALRNLGVDRGGPVRRAPTRGPASVRRRTRPTTRAGSSPGSAGASTARSSRPTPRRSGACRSRRCRPTGRRSGSRTCRSCNAIINAVAAQAQPEGHHLADRGVPVPQVRPRDDVGALPRQGRGRRASQGGHARRP